MSVLKYKDPNTGEIKKVGMPKLDAYTKSEVDDLIENLSPEDIGSVKKIGDKMTGNLTISKEEPTLWLQNETANSQTYLQLFENTLGMGCRNSIGSEDNQRALLIRNSKGSYPALNQSAALMDIVNGEKTIYNLYGEHNKPSPSDIGAATKEEVEELKTSVSEGKALIAAAVTDKGVSTAVDATFQTMANNIAAISSNGGTRFGNGIGQISSFELMFCAGGDPTNYVRPI